MAAGYQMITNISFTFDEDTGGASMTVTAALGGAHRDHRDHVTTTIHSISMPLVRDLQAMGARAVARAAQRQLDTFGEREDG